MIKCAIKKYSVLLAVCDIEVTKELLRPKGHHRHKIQIDFSDVALVSEDNDHHNDHDDHDDHDTTYHGMIVMKVIL